MSAAPDRMIVRVFQDGHLLRTVEARDVCGVATTRGGRNLIALVRPGVWWRFPMGRRGMSFAIERAP